MEDLLDKLRLWLDAPAHLSEEHAYFHEKVGPLIPEIVQTITEHRETIADLRSALARKTIQVENLTARNGRLQSELQNGNLLTK